MKYYNATVIPKFPANNITPIIKAIIFLYRTVEKLLHCSLILSVINDRLYVPLNAALYVSAISYPT